MDLQHLCFQGSQQESGAGVKPALPPPGRPATFGGNSASSCCSFVLVCVTLPCCSQFSPDACPAVLLSSAGLNLGNDTEQSAHQRFRTHLAPWPLPVRPLLDLASPWISRTSTSHEFHLSSGHSCGYPLLYQLVFTCK